MKTSVGRWARILLVTTLLSCLNLARAELPAEVSEILEASIAGTGGREVLEKIETYRISGTISQPQSNMSGTSVLTVASPDKVMSVQEVQGIGRIVQAFDGEIGWAEDPMLGFRQLGDQEIAALQENAGFSELLDYQNSFTSGKRLADSEIDGQAVAVLELVSASTGEVTTQSFSKDSGLLIRVEVVADMGPMGKLPVTMTIKTYGKQDGVAYPTAMEMENAGMIIAATFDSLELNLELDESIFSPPQ